MGVDYRRPHILVSQQLLDGPDIVPILQEVRGKRVAEGVTRGGPGQARPSHRFFDGPLDDRFMQMMPVPLGSLQPGTSPGASENGSTMIEDHRAQVEKLTLGGSQNRVAHRLRDWQENEFARRLREKDPTLWSSRPVAEITDRLGWLHLPEIMPAQVDELTVFALEVKTAGMRHVVLLGMGGSSLAPEVFQHTFGNAPGYPALRVLDSTHPAAVRSVASQIDLSRTLFVVSSKSGTTTETTSLFQ